MPITGIHWDGNTGRDIHVLRNHIPTRRLTHQALVFERENAPNQFADEYTGGDVTLKFTPLFRGALQGINFVGEHNGITVNTQTGEVTVVVGVPQNVKSNFIIEVSALNTGATQPFMETIRVQVHTSVTQAWLTPTSLLVRPHVLTWQPRSHYSVGQSLVDANHILQTVTAVTATITHVSITSNVLTLTINQNFAVGGTVIASNLIAAAFLNGQNLSVKSATAKQITADFTHTDFDSDDNGTAVATAGSGLSGDGPAAPAFSNVQNQTVTDNQLTWISQGANWNLNTPYRFAVRVQFDDEVVGDVTDNHGITWNDPGDHVQDNGTISLVAADNVGDSFAVTATLPAALGGTTTPAGPTVQVGRAWIDEPTLPTLTIIAGGGLPSAGTVEDSPNVLMLGDGFRVGDQAAFNQVVDTLVQYVKSNTLAKPFNLLSSRMNFWRAFSPATNQGISFRSEMYFSDDDQVAKAIPAVEQPPTQGPWMLKHLLYNVGLPIPAEGLGAALNLTPPDFKNRWKLLLQDDPWPHVTLEVVERWQKLAKRAFIEEIDGFPGMSYGEPPSATLSDTTLLALHEDRAGVVGLRPLYSVLANPTIPLADGRAVGVVWTEDAFRFNNRNLVVLISSFPGGRGVNHSNPINLEPFRYIAVSTKAGSAVIPVQKVAARNTYALNFTAIPADVELDRSRTIAHELAHSFGLGDEYADFDKQFPEPHAGPSQANLQTEADTQIPDPNDANKRIISGDQISWVWHRILSAAVVNGDITTEGLDTFRVPVAPDVSFRFVKGDQLLLRPRVWGLPLRKFDPLDISSALIVTEDPQPDSVIVRAIGAISAQRFPAGSLLFKPRPAPARLLSPGYPYAEMVAKNIKDAITANHTPLTELPCKLEGTGGDIQLPVLDNFDSRTPVAGVSQEPFLNMIKIVGLYANGARYSCGVFHPTGRCMMRNTHEAQTEFCAVCRYIIVDMIAPEFHSDIDTDYEKIYADTLGTLYG